MSLAFCTLKIGKSKAWQLELPGLGCLETFRRVSGVSKNAASLSQSFAARQRIRGVNMAQSIQSTGKVKSPVHCPPSSNTGANLSTAVTQALRDGPSLKGSTVHVDWLAYTVWIENAHIRPPEPRVFGNNGYALPFDVLHVMDDIQQFHLEKLYFVVLERGWQGYERTAEVRGTEQGCLGFISWGGNNGSVHVELSGLGCVGLDHLEAYRILENRGANLTRIDLAADMISTGVNWGEWIIEQHAAGGFQFAEGGKPPSMRPIYQTDDKGIIHLETTYIGTRESGKMLRGYDKGIESGYCDRGEWWRLEAELRARNNRPLPLAMLARPSHYLAGCYPCLEFLSEAPTRIKTIQKEAQGSVAKKLKWLRTQVGPTIAWLLSLGIEPEELCAAASREGRKLRDIEKRATLEDVRAAIEGSIKKLFDVPGLPALEAV